MTIKTLRSDIYIYVYIVNRRFKEIFCLYLQTRKVNQTIIQICLIFSYAQIINTKQYFEGKRVLQETNTCKKRIRTKLIVKMKIDEA